MTQPGPGASSRRQSSTPIRYRDASSQDLPAGVRGQCVRVSDVVLVSPVAGSADRGEGVPSTVDDDPRIGLQVEDFSVDLEGNSVDRRELDAADVRLGSVPNGRGTQRHRRDSPSATVPTRHHLEQPVVGAAGAAEPTTARLTKRTPVPP